MIIDTEPAKKESPVTQNPIQHHISAYTFPTDARIHQVRFDEKYLHIEFTNERIISIPLWWIPMLHNVTPAQRAQVQINRRRTMLIWESDTCDINDKLRIGDFLGAVS
ncbi:MAG: DUF2442 domain-containing protein [Caldilineaceae bacterium]